MTTARRPDRSGGPTRFGLPSIVILDAAGKELTTQDTGELGEGEHHSPEKVMAFLKKWSSPNHKR
jgi:hypothetical protein